METNTRPSFSNVSCVRTMRKKNIYIYNYINNGYMICSRQYLVHLSPHTDVRIRMFALDEVQRTLGEPHLPHLVLAQFQHVLHDAFFLISRKGKAKGKEYEESTRRTSRDVGTRDTGAHACRVRVSLNTQHMQLTLQCQHTRGRCDGGFKLHF